VLIANLIAARTAPKFGLHLCPSSAVLPPRKNDRLPTISRSTIRMCSRCSSHRGHRKRKWSTVSSSWPQSHVSVSTAPILCRYLLTRAIPVRSCTRMSDSRLFRASYTMHNHPFANPTLSPRKKKKKAPPKLVNFTYTKVGQNKYLPKRSYRY
jgi:hypothetical protein